MSIPLDRLADGAELLLITRVDGHDGGAFGNAVPFHDVAIRREFLDLVEQRFRALLRAENEDLQCIEVAGIGPIDDVLKEGRRRRHRGDLVVDCLAKQRRRIGRIGVVKIMHPGQEREQAGNRMPETVKQWQEDQHLVRTIDLQQGNESTNVRHDVVVAQRHRLRRFLRAAGEENHGRGLGLGVESPQCFFCYPFAHRFHRQQAAEFLALADGFAEFFKEDELRSGDFNAGAIDERFRGDRPA